MMNCIFAFNSEVKIRMSFSRFQRQMSHVIITTHKYIKLLLSHHIFSLFFTLTIHTPNPNPFTPPFLTYSSHSLVFDPQDVNAMHAHNLVTPPSANGWVSRAQQRQLFGAAGNQEGWMILTGSGM